MASLRSTAMISLLMTSWIVSTLAYTDCGDLKIICNRQDKMCCEGRCCPLLEQFQFITPDTKDSGPLPTPEPTMPLNRVCPAMGDQCTSAMPRGQECCADSNLRCQFSGADIKGNLFGSCCLPKDTKGCSVDSDCCGADNKCLSSMCLSSKVADAIGARYVSYQSISSQSASISSPAAAAVAQSVKVVAQSVDTVHEAVPQTKKVKWLHMEIFAVVMVATAICLLAIGFSPMIYRKCKTRWIQNREKKEIEDLSTATVSLTDTEEDHMVRPMEDL